MPEIKIKVRDKCAEGEGVIICNNSDYTVVWDLDGEWTPYDTKTMRVNLADGTYQDVVFTGNAAALPVLTASGWVSVGLYAGDIHTSRAARLLALSSVLTPGGSPAAPAEDVYAQIMAKLNELSTVSPEDIAKAVEDYLTEHPAASASMRVEGGYIQFSGDGKTWENVIALADLKGPKGDTGAGMDVTGATVDQIAKISAIDDKGVPTAWEPVDMPSGGGDETWEKIADVALSADTSLYIVANFATWRKVKIILDRDTFISGLSKNVWCRLFKGKSEYASLGYLTSEYGYLHWEFGAEVNDLFATSSKIASNNRYASTYITSTGTFLLYNVSPDDLDIGILFTDTSVIQAGDKITVLGVRR
uniref:Uncharacterized protein n=1 Tax=Siphoviridae sp. ctFBb37 TaxID=2827565 RepID=A0A8S5RSQ8_9CAUD|nr:MAG TPA: hypothetical protein [Siphoviridae sp. ctFBb37]